MKGILHRIISLTMAFLLLLSTVSWTVDKHLCMGRTMDVALFTGAKDCGMKAAMDLLEEQGVENHCCEDESFTVQGQDDLRLSWDDITLEQQHFLIAYSYSYFGLFNFRFKEKLPNLRYPPPLLVSDIQLLDQVFLI